MAKIFSIYNYKPAKKLMSISGDAESAKYWFQVTLENAVGGIEQATIRIVAKKSETGLDESGYIILSTLCYKTNLLSLASGARKTFGEYINISRTMLDRMTAASIRAVPIYIYAEVQYIGSAALYTQLIEIPECRVLNCYANPAIADFSIERGTDGMESDEGINLLTTLKLSCTSDTLTEQMQLTLHYAENAAADKNSPSVDLSAYIPQLIAGVELDPNIITQTFSNNRDWGFYLTFGDEYESAAASAQIFKAFANLHLSGKPTGGACFGGFSKSENGKPMLESHYRFYPYGGIEGVNVYTLGEVKTGGLWIDRKPIYRQIIKVGELAAGKYFQLMIAPDFETVIDMRGVIYRDNGVHSTLNWRGNGSTVYGWDTYFTSDGMVTVRTNSSTKVAGGHIIFEYTKTTDEPVEDYPGYAVLVDSEGYLVIDSAGNQILVKE